MTPDDVRVKMLDDYKNNRFQFLTNCGVATEGFDSPGIQVVVMARPTKSRALYTQMLGRGTRTVAELVDGLATALERRTAIAASAKPFCEIIDFVGNTGRHELVSTANILGGKYSDEVIAAAKREIAEHDNESCDTEDVLRRAKARLEEEEAERAEAAKRALIIGKATWSSSVNRPFVTLGINVKDRGWDKPATPDQHAFLAKNKFDSENLSANQAQAMIGEVLRRRKHHLASVRMAAILKRNGFSENMSMEKAKQIMDILASNRWRWPQGMAVPE
jgi:type I site-specific restriction endonuclease